MAEQSRLEREAADELKLLCSRDAFQGWTRLTNGLDGGGEAFLALDWDKWWGLEWG